jgi:hypothetical protein
MSETKWSKHEKEIARRAFDAAYKRECMTILEKAREMAAKANTPAALWEIHDYLTEKRKETDEKYDYRYSVLLLVFARLVREGWIQPEEIAGLSDDKRQMIRGMAEW